MACPPLQYGGQFVLPPPPEGLIDIPQRLLAECSGCLETLAAAGRGLVIGEAPGDTTVEHEERHLATDERNLANPAAATVEQQGMAGPGADHGDRVFGHRTPEGPLFSRQ